MVFVSSHRWSHPVFERLMLWYVTLFLAPFESWGCLASSAEVCLCSGHKRVQIPPAIPCFCSLIIIVSPSALPYSLLPLSPVHSIALLRWQSLTWWKGWEHKDTLMSWWSLSLRCSQGIWVWGRLAHILAPPPPAVPVPVFLPISEYTVISVLPRGSPPQLQLSLSVLSFLFSYLSLKTNAIIPGKKGVVLNRTVVVMSVPLPDPMGFHLWPRDAASEGFPLQISSIFLWWTQRPWVFMHSHSESSSSHPARTNGGGVLFRICPQPAGKWCTRMGSV